MSISPESPISPLGRRESFMSAPYSGRDRGRKVSTTSSATESVDGDERKAPAGYVRQLAAATMTLVSGASDEVQSMRIAREDELIELSRSCSKLETPVAEILSKASDSSDDSVGNSPSSPQRLPSTAPERHVGSPLLLRLCGILPWGCGDTVQSHRRPLASISRYSLLILSVLAVAVSTAQIVQLTGMDHCQGTACRPLYQLSSLVFALSSLMGLIVIRAVPKGKLLGSSKALLVACARQQGVVDTWSRRSRTQSVFMAFLWVCSLFAHTMGVRSAGWQGVVSVFAFFVTSSIFVALTCTILHVNCCLTLLIDAYCSHFPECPNVDCSVREWNILQAVLRKASGAVEKGFVVLQTTALVTSLLAIVDLLFDDDSQFWNLLSVALLGFGEARLIFKSAEVTEKCTRLPSLINSLSFGVDVDMARHYLVEYVTYSGAGFYVGEVRLTNAMAMRLAYISLLVAFGVMTKTMSTQPHY